MSTRWPAPRFFWRPTCRATSPGRRSTSTVELMPPAAGITTPRRARTRSEPQTSEVIGRTTQYQLSGSLRCPDISRSKFFEKALDRLFAAIQADVRRHSAVDSDHLSGDVAGLLRGEEDDQFGDILR